MSLSHFTPLSKLGEGSFSTVVKVRRKKDGKVYAMKQVPVTQLSEKDRESAVNEVRLLASIRHPNIIAYKQAFVDEPTKTLWYRPRSIVMEFADAGDLHQRIAEQQRMNTYLGEDFVWSILLQATLGLQQLHALHIAHRDIKSANVFLFKDGAIKLGDFNVSKVTKDAMLQTQTGTPYYASPEVWSVKPYDHKTDIWSLGCVIYEAAALCPPFRAGDLDALHRIISQGVVPPLPMQFSHELQRMVVALLAVDPVRRPSCEAILKSPCMQRRMARSGAMSDSVLLKTIRVPADLGRLEEKLPKSRYTGEEQETLPRLVRLPTTIPSPFSNVRSDSQSPYRQLRREVSHQTSLEMSPSREYVRKQYYRGRDSQDSMYQVSRREASGSRVLDSVRRSLELREGMKSRVSHARQRMFLPTDPSM